MTNEAVSRGNWNPAQYERFRDERSRPFYDLAALVQPRPGMRVVDLGCGTGELTAWLHGELQAAETVGVDSSDPMLEKAASQARPGLRFDREDIRMAPARYLDGFDLVFSNAALQWVTGHETLFVELVKLVRPGGQIAVQMPANQGVPHRLTAEVARQEPFATALAGWVREDPVRDPVFYSRLLSDLGFAEQHVRLQIYPHVMESTHGAVEWLKGSLLTAYQARMPADLWQRYLEAYEAALLAAEGDRRPYFFPFPRILIWGRLA